MPSPNDLSIKHTLKEGVTEMRTFQRGIENKPCGAEYSFREGKGEQAEWAVRDQGRSILRSKRRICLTVAVNSTRRL